MYIGKQAMRTDCVRRTVQGPFAELHITACSDGVLRVDWDEVDDVSGMTRTVDVHHAQAEHWAEEAARQLQEYFAGCRRAFDVPLVFTGTAFQTAVWKALLDIPYGETRSYQDIARAIGNAKAVRAVGQANRRNPIPVIVPCHRVIGRDGSLVGYAGDQLHIKTQLLALEGCAHAGGTQST